MTIATFTIPGNPAPKKNSGRVVFLGQRCRGCNRGKFPKILPAETWERWTEDAMKLLATWRPDCLSEISRPVNARALFYRDSLRSVDPVNLYEGLADLLEMAGIVDDDKRIRSWDGSRVFLDRHNPRTEVQLEEATAAEDGFSDAPLFVEYAGRIKNGGTRNG